MLVKLETRIGAAREVIVSENCTSIHVERVDVRKPCN